MKIFLLQTKTNIFNKQEYSFKVFDTWSTLAFHIYLQTKLPLSVISCLCRIGPIAEQSFEIREFSITRSLSTRPSGSFHTAHLPACCITLHFLNISLPFQPSGPRENQALPFQSSGPSLGKTQALPKSVELEKKV